MEVNVIKTNMRRANVGETRMNNLKGNELNHYPSRETEGQGSSRSACRRDDQSGEKMSFNKAFSTTTSGYSEDNSNRINIQLGLSEEFNNTSSTNPFSTLLPKASVNYWNRDQIMEQEDSRVPRPCSLGQNNEKELKRQKRKEANRESARRSRMRKQSECDELTERVQNLTAENETLRLEVHRLGDLCQKLSAENAILRERLVN